MSTLTQKQWDGLPLGTVDDSGICRLAHVRHGVWPSLTDVAAERMRRGIPEHIQVPAVQLPPAESLNLSAEEPDAVAAERTGRTVKEVRTLRRGQGLYQRRPFTPEDREYFAKAYEDGVPVGTIASKLERTEATIYQTARVWGLKRPGGSGTGKPKQQVWSSERLETLARLKRLRCQKCGATSETCKTYLRRVSAGGIDEIWECGKSCTLQVTPEEASFKVPEDDRPPLPPSAPTGKPKRRTS